MIATIRLENRGGGFARRVGRRSQSARRRGDRLRGVPYVDVDVDVTDGSLACCRSSESATEAAGRNGQAGQSAVPDRSAAILVGMAGSDDLIGTPELAALIDLFRRRRVVALAGAGCSTESGIPDYRGPQGTLRHRQPMQYQEFVRSAAGRARYWARSTVGWSRVRHAAPNAAHLALARLEAAGAVAGIITQNVDGLHHAAGSRTVVELHGSLARVRCLGCGRTAARDAFQHRLLAVNRAWWERLRSSRGPAVRVAPDGDAELSDQLLEDFRVPACDACGGVIKPDVVFFGENVPKDRVDAAWRLFETAEVLLVVGSSLTVFSGRRFIYRARDGGIPIAVVNLGPTRADDVAAVKVDGRLGDVLPRLAAELADATSSAAEVRAEV